MVTQLKDLEKKLNLLRSKSSSVETEWMLALCEQAVQTGLKGNYPVASAIALESGDLDFFAVNESLFPAYRSSKHAEMITLDQQEEKSPSFKDVHLVCTLEPCLMCTSRIALSKVAKVTYLISDPAGGGVTTGMVFPPDFQTNLSRIKFEKFTQSSELSYIGKLLYEIGENVWQQRVIK